ncbi:MAG: hypothetical protein LQ348_005139 [Seirophora lacunosa]|nr:MAG: hypothetical protein LQ348_005139 [Seirophora lacunosa]
MSPDNKRVMKLVFQNKGAFERLNNQFILERIVAEQVAKFATYMEKQDCRKLESLSNTLCNDLPRRLSKEVYALVKNDQNPRVELLQEGLLAMKDSLQDMAKVCTETQQLLEHRAEKATQDQRIAAIERELLQMRNQTLEDQMQNRTLGDQNRTLEDQNQTLKNQIQQQKQFFLNTFGKLHTGSAQHDDEPQIEAFQKVLSKTSRASNGAYVNRPCVSPSMSSSSQPGTSYTPPEDLFVGFEFMDETSMGTF